MLAMIGISTACLAASIRPYVAADFFTLEMKVVVVELIQVNPVLFSFLQNIVVFEQDFLFKERFENDRTGAVFRESHDFIHRTGQS